MRSSFLPHDLSQQGIGSGLVPFALLAWTSKHIRIEAKSYLLLDGPVEWVPHRFPPELVISVRECRTNRFHGDLRAE